MILGIIVFGYLLEEISGRFATADCAHKWGEEISWYTYKPNRFQPPNILADRPFKLKKL